MAATLQKDLSSPLIQAQRNIMLISSIKICQVDSDTTPHHTIPSSPYFLCFNHWFGLHLNKASNKHLAMSTN